MIEQYKRITSLVCLACYETDKCKECNIDEMAKRIIDDTRAEVIEECIEAIYENTLNPVWEYGEGVNDCVKALEQLKENK